LIHSDEGLTLQTSAFESLYGGQFTLSTQLIKPNYLVILPTDAAPLETYPLETLEGVLFKVSDEHLWTELTGQKIRDGYVRGLILLISDKNHLSGFIKEPDESLYKVLICSFAAP